MSGTTGSQDVGEQLITRPAAPDAAAVRGGRSLTWLAVTGIVGSTLIMIAASAVRNRAPRLPGFWIPAATTTSGAPS